MEGKDRKVTPTVWTLEKCVDQVIDERLERSNEQALVVSFSLFVR